MTTRLSSISLFVVIGLVLFILPMDVPALVLNRLLIPTTSNVSLFHFNSRFPALKSSIAVAKFKIASLKVYQES